MAGSRKQPFWIQQDQQFAESHLQSSHADALYRFGEFGMFSLLWTAKDYAAGLVGKCPTCMGDRISQAYDQSVSDTCPDCYGTTFEGGLRAQIIRPAIVTDRNTETRETVRGEVNLDSISLETTHDFFSRSGDLYFRLDGNRYRLDQMETITIRSGFDTPFQDETMGGVIATGRREDPASTAHKIPPLEGDLVNLLTSLRQDRHTPYDLTAFDQKWGPLVPKI